MMRYCAVFQASGNLNWNMDWKEPIALLHVELLFKSLFTCNELISKMFWLNIHEDLARAWEEGCPVTGTGRKTTRPEYCAPVFSGTTEDFMGQHSHYSKKKKKANRNVAFQSSTNSKITINQNFSVDSHYRLSHPQKVHTQHINECFKE